MATILNESFGGRISDGGYPPEIGMCFGTGDGVSETHCADPVFDGRWQYSTMLLPMHLTDGNKETKLTLTTLEGHSMQSLFRGYTHTSAMVPLPAEEHPPPPPPAAPPMPRPPSSSASQFEYLLDQVDGGVEQVMARQLWGPTWDAAVAADPSKSVLTGGLWPHTIEAVNFTVLSKDHIKDECAGASTGSNNNGFRGLEVMARAYHLNSSKFHLSSDVLARIVAGVDYFGLAQGLNGGFDPRPRLSVGWIGAPNRKNGSGCLEGYGHMGFSAAVDLVAEVVSNETLSEMVDADDTGQKTLTRRDSWARLLVNSRDYLQWNRGHAPNQDLADILAAQIADHGLGKIAPSCRISREAMLRGVKQAVGILQQPADGWPYKPPPGYGPVSSTNPGYWFSKEGISMEPNTNVNGGYSHGYVRLIRRGPSTVRLNPVFRFDHVHVTTTCAQGDEEWALGWLAKLVDDDDVTELARLHVQNFGRFRYEDNCQTNVSAADASMVTSRCMRLESVITWVRFLFLLAFSIESLLNPSLHATNKQHRITLLHSARSRRDTTKIRVQLVTAEVTQGRS
jgi:hypothetical protein